MEEKEKRFYSFLEKSGIILLLVVCLLVVVAAVFHHDSMIANYLKIDNQMRVTVMKINFIAMLLCGASDIIFGIIAIVGGIYFAIKKHKTKKTY